MTSWGCPWGIQVERTPGQQVQVGLILGQHDRPLRQLGDALTECGQGRLAVGVAACHQPGPPPPGHLAHPAAQGGKADRGAAQPLVEPGDRPRSWLGQQAQDALGEPRAATAWPARAGLVA
jgi:hypothetical protein